MTPEFSRPVRADDAGVSRQPMLITADAAERAAVATRFGLLTLDRLEARLMLVREAVGIRVKGSVDAEGAQPCGLSAEPVTFRLSETVALLFTGARPEGDEIELDEADLDAELLTGDTIDLGEVAAQSMALALDPYPRAAGAVAPGIVIDEETARRAASPFAVLKGGKARPSDG
jgi:uncharacterized metal-binding protein YceD (DUF177 family)